MKRGYKLNIKNNTLYITKGFERRAGIYGTDEYAIFRDLKKDNPDMKIEYAKEYKTERSRENVHDGLTTEFMKEEIKNSENAEAIKELERIIKHFSETNKYAGKLKKLYFDTYPDKATLATIKKKEKARRKEGAKIKYLEYVEHLNNIDKNENSSTSGNT